jgi:prephenate dehydratase
MPARCQRSQGQPIRAWSYFGIFLNRVPAIPWQMQTVFFLGPEGTFSHILARKRFGNRARLEACATLEAVVESAVGQPGSLALVPVENSSGGTVYDSIDVLIRHSGHLAVDEELALDVRIALLRQGAGPVQTVYSHFTQLKHHAGWLKARFPKARLKAVDSTALAARRASLAHGAAALASPGAAEIYGLDVEEIPASDHAANVTHFFLVRSGEPVPYDGKSSSKTALVVALPNVCGSLHAFLGPFARLGISLSRIVSRPVPGKPRTYVFFLEIEGDPRRENVRKALASAGRKAETMVSLGSFPCGKRFKS